MDSNNLRCIFHKDPYAGEIFEGVFAKDQFMNEHFKKETGMCVVNEQDSQFPGSHLGDGVSRREKYLFHSLS